MVYLLLSILSSTVIAITFKLQDRLGIKLFPIIVINYLVATIMGFSVLRVSWIVEQIITKPWVLTAFLVGIMLILGFFVIGLSIQRAGISATIVASKMSVVIPILFSILAFHELVTSLKVIGLVLAMVGIVLTVFPSGHERKKGQLLLPLLLFLTLGVIDSLVKLGQTQVEEQFVPLFTALSFGMSAVIGLGISIARRTLKELMQWREIVAGIVLGLANWGSMYFMIQALGKSGLDSSVVFGINNIGVISLSVILAFIFFHERLSSVNWIGVLVSILAAWILSAL